MSIDLTGHSFSRHGCSLSIHNRPHDDGDLILLNHHSGGAEQEVMRLQAQRSGAVCPLTFSAGIGSYIGLCDGAEALRIALAAPGLMRIEGLGLDLRLALPEAAALTLAPEGRRCIIINRPSCRRRYAVVCHHGSITIDDQAGLALGAADDGRLACTVEEHSSTWIPAGPCDQQTLARQSKASYDAFRAPFQVADDSELADRAVYTLWSTVMPAHGCFTRPAILPTLDSLPQITGWESCFTAMALAGAHDRLAWDQYLLPFDHQDTHGCLPWAVMIHDRRFDACPPPIHGWTVAHLLAHSSPEVWTPLLPEIYQGLALWTLWWLNHRRRSGQRLAHYALAQESGWSASSAFDQGVPLVSPDLAALLICQCDVLRTLARRLARHQDALQWRTSAETLSNALIGDLWNGRRFASALLTADGPEALRDDSLQGCLPVILAGRLPGPVRNGVVADTARFITGRLLASQAPGSATYDPGHLWRGAVHPQAVALISQGLAACGQRERAEAITGSLLDCCRTHGLAPAFAADDGRALSTGSHAISAAVYLDILRGRLPGHGPRPS